MPTLMLKHFCLSIETFFFNLITLLSNFSQLFNSFLGTTEPNDLTSCQNGTTNSIYEAFLVMIDRWYITKNRQKLHRHDQIRGQQRTKSDVLSR